MKNDQDIKSKLENIEKILQDEITMSKSLELKNHLEKAIQQLKIVCDQLLKKDDANTAVELQLTESEERYKRIISGISDYVYTVKVDKGRVTGTIHNENCFSITGYTSDEFKRDPNLWINMVVSQDREWVAERFARLLKGEDLFSIEHCIICKNGQIKWISDTLIPKHDANNNLVEYDGVIKDITEKKKADEALIENEEKHRFLFENMTQGVVFHSRDGKIIYANQSSAEILGLTLDQLFGKTSFDPRWKSIHEDGSDYPGETHPVMITLKTGKEVRNAIMGVYNPVKNVYRWININSTPKYDSSGKSIEMVVVTIEDITFLKQAEETLKLRESYLSSIIENQPGLVWLKDKQSVFLAVNQTFARVCGLELPELLTGKTDFDIWPEELAQKYRADDAEVMTSRKAKVVEEPIAEKGKIKWFETFKTPVFDSHGKILGTTGYSHDITDRKLAEKDLRESKARLESIFRVAPTGIGVVRERIIKEVNTHLCEMSGYTSEQLIGKSARILYPNQEEFEFVGKEKYKQINESGTGTVETKWIKKDGSIIDVLLSSTPIDIKDQLKGVTFTALDITERKHAEATLQASEALYRKMNENSPLGMHFYKLNNNNQLVFEGANPAADTLLRVDNSQFIGKTIEEAFSLLAQTEVPERYSEAAKNGTPWSTEQIAYDDNKIVGAFAVRAFQTIPGSMVAIFDDITKRKQAEQALKENNLRLELAMQAANMAWWEMDITTGKVVFEKRKAEMLGFPPEIFKHYKDFMSLVHPKDYDKAMNAMRAHFDGTIDKYEVEYRIKTKSGEYKWFLDIGAIVKKDSKGMPQTITGLVINITERKQTEAALLESESRFKTLSSIATEGLMIHEKGIILDINAAFAKLLGYSNPDELIGENSFEITPLTPESKQIVLDHIQTNSNETYDIEISNLSGEIIPVETRGTEIFYKGRTARLVYMRDITERKQAERLLQEKNNEIEAQNEEYQQINEELLQANEELQKSKEHAEENEINLRKIIDNSPLPMVISAENKYVEYVNDRFTQLYGYKQNDIPTAEKWFQAAYPEESYRQHVIEKWMGAIEKAVINNTNVDPQTYNLTTKDGAKRTCEFHIVLMGEKAVIVANDVTERKLFEIELIAAKEKAEESEKRLRSMFSTANTGFVLISPTGKILEWNNTFINFFGYSEEEFKELTSKDITYPDDIPDSIESIKQLITGQTSNFRIEKRFVRKDKSVFWVDLFASPLKKADRIYALLGVVNEITERKNFEYDLILAKEHAEESDRLKTAFLQNMSHEIRTPMNAIMGFSELLAQHYNNKTKLERYSQIINQRCNDLLEIINDILDIAKIESGQLAINNEYCNIIDMFDELLLFYSEQQKRIGKQHILFNLNFQCNPSESIVLTDKGKLKQIFINLLTNAFKFTESGKIEGGCKLDDKNRMVFYVKDTGIGVPFEKQNKIFERFTQLNSDEKKVYGGTGLGLSIVKGLLHLLEGEIWLESEPGKGTTFYFTFPMRATKKESNIILQAEDVEEQVLINKTILLVEDDLYNAEFIKESLSTFGVNLILAVSGMDAIKIAVEQPVDLILMDIRLPDINGYEAVKLIRKQKPAIKIIAQTAYAAREEQVKALDAGCDAYLSKPLKLPIFLETLKTQLSKK